MDVISVMIEGRVAHAGSLEDGTALNAPDVQVQRAGSEGFEHNEVNPDDVENRMIQIWVLPEQSGERAAYGSFTPQMNAVTRVYGGSDSTNDLITSQTVIEIARYEAGGIFEVDQPVMAYITKGNGFVNGQKVKAGQLIRAERLQFEAREDVHVILITEEK